MWVVLIDALIALGVAVLAKLAVEIADLCYADIAQHIKKWKKKKGGGTLLFVDWNQLILSEVYNKAKEDGKVYEWADIERKLADNEGTLEVFMDQNGHIDESGLKLYRAKQPDTEFERVMIKNDGLIVIKI